MNEGIRRKTIEIRFSVTTGTSNWEICQMVCNLLNATVLSAPEFDIDIQETKVIKDEPYIRSEGVS